MTDKIDAGTGRTDARTGGVGVSSAAESDAPPATEAPAGAEASRPVGSAAASDPAAPGSEPPAGGQSGAAPGPPTRLVPVLRRLLLRLTALDVLNRAILFAAVLLVCLVPFVLVVQAFAGRAAATSLVRRFGLSDGAARAASSLLTSPTATSAALSGLSSVLFVLGGLAAAGAMQELYLAVFELPGRGWKELPLRLAWLAILLAGASGMAWIGPTLDTVGGPVLLAAAALVLLVGFWWVTIFVLLGGRRRWPELLPAAIATAVFWLGMSVVFKLTMSNSIATNYAKYGTVGVILSLMSYLIAIGVVVVLGAVVGLLWRERASNDST